MSYLPPAHILAPDVLADQLPTIALPVFAENDVVPALIRETSQGPKEVANTLLVLGAQAVREQESDPARIATALAVGDLTIALTIRDGSHSPEGQSHPSRTIGRETVPLNDITVTDIEKNTWSLLLDARGETITIGSYNSNYRVMTSFTRPGRDGVYAPQRFWYYESESPDDRDINLGTDHGITFGGVHTVPYSKLVAEHYKRPGNPTLLWPPIRPLQILHAARQFLQNAYTEKGYATARIGISGKGL